MPSGLQMMRERNAFTDAIADAEFTFDARPEPVAGDLRMSWGMAVLLLSLFYSRGKKANFQKLQFLAHAVRVEEGRDEVLGLLSGRYRPKDVSVRFEPWLNRAAAFAHAADLVCVSKGKTVALSERGLKVAEALQGDPELLRVEREFLKDVAPRLTDALMKSVWRTEDLL